MALNLNVTEPGAYFRLTDGSLTKIGPVAITSNGSAPNAAAAGPTGNVAGETWLDGRTSYANPVMKVFNGTSWVTASGFQVDNGTGNFQLSKTLTVNTLVANGTGVNGYVRLPNGPASDEAVIPAAAGMIRFDTTTNSFRGFNGSTWGDLGSGTIAGNLDVTGDADINGNLDVTGSVVLGNDIALDTLTVNAQALFNGNVTVGTTSATNLIVNSTSDFRSNVSISSQADLRFHSGLAGATNWVGFQAPGSIPTSTLWTLPSADGSSGQVLSTNGAGILSWSSVSGGATVTVSDTAPSSPAPANGDLWYNSEEGRLFVYYTDPSSNQWVDASPQKDTSTLLPDDSVTTSKIVNLAVTAGKLAENAVTTTKINNGAVTVSKMSFDGTILPTQDAVFNLGSASFRFANIYTGDLHLANERGDWTVIEEEEFLSLRNNKTGKIFKIVMEEIG